MAEETYPEELSYHPEHDWARIEGEEATFGITWYAQDALGEVVFYEPPEVGAEVTKDEPYAEVESVKAVSDVYAPLSGEIAAVNAALSDTPETINEDPYGEGWLVKVKLSRPGRGRRAARRRRLPGAARRATERPRYASRSAGEPLHVSHRRRPRGDAGARSGSTRPRSCSPTSRPSVRLDRPLDLADGLLRDRGLRPARRARRRATPTPTPRSASSAPGCTTTTCPRSSTRSPRARSS